MRARLRRHFGIFLATVSVAATSHAGPPRYNLQASAFNDGDSHESNADPDAVAHGEESVEGGAAIYDASANASSGALAASASRGGTLPFSPNQRRSVARIEERIHFDAIPAGSVTIRAELTALPAITGTGATASSLVRLWSTPTSSCQGSIFVTSAGEEVIAGCNFGDGAGAGFAQITLTPSQLADAGYVVDVDAQVDASVHGVANGFTGVANAEGTLSISIQPLTTHHFTGPNTAFPVPEPDAALASVAAAAALAALRRLRG